MRFCGFVLRSAVALPVSRRVYAPPSQNRYRRAPTDLSGARVLGTLTGYAGDGERRAAMSKAMRHEQQPEPRRHGHDPLEVDSSQEERPEPTASRTSAPGSYRQRPSHDPQKSPVGSPAPQEEAEAPRAESGKWRQGEEPDFASEHYLPSYADQLEGGPEGVLEPESPRGYAGMDS